MLITLSATVVMVKNEIESGFFRGIITDALTYIKISRYRYVCDKDSIKRERERVIVYNMCYIFLK